MSPNNKTQRKVVKAWAVIPNQENDFSLAYLAGKKGIQSCAGGLSIHWTKKEAEGEKILWDIKVKIVPCIITYQLPVIKKKK